MSERVVLVDAQDRPVGVEEKRNAHLMGRLHRAFSVFVFRSDGAMLLQRRADGKYHSGGLWSNTACGHPRPGEPTVAAARRRLREEMGFETDLRSVLSFTYRVDLGGLVEHEVDHVLVGVCDARPVPSPEEVSDWRWVATDEVVREAWEHPDRFTPWFPLALRELMAAGATEGSHLRYIAGRQSEPRVA